MRPTEPRPLTDTEYVPPQRMFWRCRCGALVLKTKDGLVTPALGYPHVCRKEAYEESGPQAVNRGRGVCKTPRLTTPTR